MTVPDRQKLIAGLASDLEAGMAAVQAGAPTPDVAMGLAKAIVLALISYELTQKTTGDAVGQ